MQHELLLALAGHTGSVFTLHTDSCQVRVASDFPFLTDAEREVLNRIAQVGYYYKELLLIIEARKNRNNVNNVCGDHSVAALELYRLAFCSGLDAVIASYRSTLLQLEAMVLQQPHTPLLIFSSELAEHAIVLPALLSVARKVDKGDVRGCQIVTLLYEESACGVPAVRAALEEVLHSCHRLLLRQMAAWMVHGLLQDSAKEFFIRYCQSSYHDISSTEGSHVKPVSGYKENESNHDNVLDFEIAIEYLPGHLPLRLAHKVLFIGKAVRTLRHHGELHRDISKKGMRLGRNAQHNGTNEADVVHEINDAVSAASEREEQLNYKRKETSDEVRYHAMLEELHEMKILDLMRMEAILDTMRKEMAKRLWTLVVTEGELKSQLETIKDFFLLGKGELFLCFLDFVHPLMELPVPPQPAADYDLNAVFLRAGTHVCTAEEDQRFREFKMVVSQPPEKGNIGKDAKAAERSSNNTKDDRVTPGFIDGWRYINLVHKVAWPASLLLTPSVLEKYNEVFQFLFAVRRVQAELHRSWADHMMSRKTTESPMCRLLPQWLLRSQMAFLIDNLQYYLQLDVIESLYFELSNRIDSSSDFESVQRAHDEFLSTLLARCFLYIKPVSRCLDEVFALCRSFCSQLPRFAAIDSTASAQDLAELKQVTLTFQRQAGFLFKLLSGVKTHQSSPHLAQLLLRIDFNFFYTRGVTHRKK